MNHTRSAYFFDELSERLQETNKNAKIKIEDRIEHTIVDLRWSVSVISVFDAETEKERIPIESVKKFSKKGMFSRRICSINYRCDFAFINRKKKERLSSSQIGIAVAMTMSVGFI